MRETMPEPTPKPEPSEAADRDPRRDPIPGDVLQCGRSIFRVIPRRFPSLVGWRHPQTRPYSSNHVSVAAWRRMMRDPNVIIVKRGDAPEAA